MTAICMHFSRRVIFVIPSSYSMRQMLIWPFRILYTSYALAWFILFMVLVFPAVVTAIFFGRVHGGNLINRILRLWSGAWFFVVGIRHRNIYIFRPDAKAKYIFVPNHVSYLDAAIAVESIRQPFRALGKMEMKHLPVFGWIYRVFVIMVDRKDPADRARSLQDMRKVLTHGISLLIFPEGTFNMSDQPLKSFFDGAFRIAIETQTPIVPVIFLDALDRMHYSHIFSLTPGLSRSVFLNPVPVDGLTIDDLPVLKAKVYQIMESALLDKANYSA